MIVIYISGGIDPEILNQLIKKYSLNPSGYSQQWWDFTMLKGLSDNLNVDLFCISVPPIPTFPSSNCIFLPKIEDGKITNYCVLRAINLPLVKQLQFKNTLYRKIKGIIKQHSSEQIIILTSYIYYNTAKPAIELRKKYSNVKIATFVPDLPDFYGNKDLGRHRVLKRMFDFYKKQCISIKNEFDAYLCFSEKQMDFLNSQKPFCVIEGVLDRDTISKVEQIEVQKSNIMLYAGGVHYKYGIKELVDAFSLLQRSDVQLHIYGSGDAVDYVKGKERVNVFYCGIATRDEILTKEREAILLLNPRPIAEDFSACSFPSKLMEYMASGTPVLTTRLKCITKQYDDLMLYIDDVSAEGIKKSIMNFLDNYQEYCNMGIRAKEYVINNKNEIHQATVAVDFLRSI